MIKKPEQCEGITPAEEKQTISERNSLTQAVAII